ncbi:MAG: diguanylate cyclase domain-containing protein [Kineosporiaceae bacterium]
MGYHVTAATPGRHSSKTWLRAAVLAVVAVIAFAAVLLTKPLSESAMTAFTDIGQFVAAALGGCGAAWAAVRAWRAGQQRLATSWGLIALGAWSWAWGEAIWTGYEVILAEDVPFPSLADVGFLGLPLLAGIGLLIWPTGAEEARDRLVALLDGAMIGAGLLLISWATSLGATVEAGGESTLSIAIAAAYPVGDVLLVSLVVLLLTRAAPTNRTALLLLSAGLVLFAISDSAFMYTTSTGTYSSGAIIDAGWFAGFLAIGVAGVAMGAAPVARTRTRQSVTWRRFALPYIPAGLALLTFFGSLVAGNSLHVVEVVCAVIIVAAMMARQFLLLADNHELLAAANAGEAEVREIAFHDPLTGLVNRPLFEDRVQHALQRAGRDGRLRAVMVVDIDDFRHVSEGMGAAAGDQVVAEVAHRLQSCVRDADTVARIGGDEFAVLLEAGNQLPERVAERIVETLRTVVDVSGEPVPISASVGLAVDESRRPLIGASDLLMVARQAVMQAKAAGKDRFAALAAIPRQQAR